MINGWWKNSRGDWFYLNPDFKGRMHIGWLKYKEDWYFLDKNGAMLRGFQNINGKTYFFVEDGRMLSNTDVEGRHLGADGAATQDSGVDFMAYFCLFLAMNVSCADYEQAFGDAGTCRERV